jgi:hypothetical protein
VVESRLSHSAFRIPQSVFSAMATGRRMLHSCKRFKQGLKLIDEVRRIGSGQSGNPDDLPNDLKTRDDRKEQCRSLRRSLISCSSGVDLLLHYWLFVVRHVGNGRDREQRS